MEPLKFNPIYFESVWGGNQISKFRNNVPSKKIGQVWDVSCHKNGMNTISSNYLNGYTIEMLLKEKRADILGLDLINENFPLHLSIIDANDNLSIQVHPKDSYAYKNLKESGKTEAWYIMDCPSNAYLFAGTDLSTPEDIIYKISNQIPIEKIVNKIPVKKGDFIVIPSGLIHALGKGILAIEISQNADTTYRIYDYNRGRNLNIKESLSCIDPTLKPIIAKGLTTETKNYSRTFKYFNKYFSAEIINVKKVYSEMSNPNRFYILVCTEGQGFIEYQSGSIPFNYGDTILIPAELGKYSIYGENLSFFKTYKPNLNEVENTILSFIK